MDNIRVEPDSSSPAIAKKPVGRPRILTAEHLEVLAELARETPVSSRWDIARAFKRRTGLTVSPDTLRKPLRALGFFRQERGHRRPQRRQPSQGVRRCAVVHSAGVQDRDGAFPAIEAAKQKSPSLTEIYADAAYEGRNARAIEARRRDRDRDRDRPTARQQGRPPTRPARTSVRPATPRFRAPPPRGGPG